MTKEQQDLINEIQFITDVDFVPSKKGKYNMLPEPHRSEALAAFKYREQHFDEMSKAKLKKYE